MIKDNTRIYDRFEWWSVDDCRCEFCRWYRGKKRPCPLEVCCIDDVRQEALRREHAAQVGAAERPA